ncbi:probable E3 ubiquitin-protein ligase bre1 isoform X1 [Drosophila albomicans]|uniref:Probable E3 ubiquitin-protein ligase bre1 isoform X1 n=2 Tax=Drosophila albomicans TaxID=7291 RepID=A0A9C6T0W0_DROAB|nr:probable E3 ubiquitin-protein ligase bre1 isoform X1 [Drosophila albomicans]
MPTTMLEEDNASLKKASITATVSTAASLFENSSKCQPNDNDDDLNVDCDSYGSMETLSDTVSITIDGEKHWVSGVDSSTTCADLICALLQYQDLEEKHGSSSTKAIGKSNNQITIQTKEEDDQQATNFSKSLVKKNSHEYVIVKQLRNCHFEEYLDGSTRLLDVIPLRDNFGKKLCELQLRNLARTTPALTAARVNNQNHNHNQLFSMLSMSTDKDSGMGSPVGSSRSERFRRRRGKQRASIAAAAAAATKSVAQMALQRAAGDQQPKRSKQQQQQQQQLQQQQSEQQQAEGEQEEEEKEHCNGNPNERLMNIILAQDETIHRQMCLLNEKEQQILKIEEEKHRVRERELGKNYLLDAYLKTIDKPAEAGDEQRHRIPQFPTVDSNLSDDMQIYWLEKVYTLNKQLQREEEQLLRLHAKVRKQQVRYAYHTKGEVLQQIDRLDGELAVQVADIYRVERQLLMANEQLKAKLGVLECLGREFEVLPHVNESPDLAPSCHANVQQLRETIRKQDPQQIEKNCNVRQLTDAKMLKKQFFGVVDNPETSLYATDLDIEHLGTLV